MALIEKEHLFAGAPSGAIIPSQEELKQIMLAASKDGGRLDFFTPIKGKENEGVQIRPGVFSTKAGIALYMWGSAVFDLGVNTVEDAWGIYSTLIGREINVSEKDYIQLGFTKALDK